jgi:caa(3)-type oxidase subunit IV
MAGHTPEGLSLDEAEKLRNKKYLKVFYALCLFTFLEVLPTFFEGKIPKIAMDLWIILFTALKAGFVGYYFMHLEYETKWTKIIAALPLGILFYAAVLMPDTRHSRPVSLYVPTPDRVFPELHVEQGQAETKDAPHEGHAPEASAQADTSAQQAASTKGGPLPDTDSAEKAAGAKVLKALQEQAAAQAEARKSGAASAAPAVGAGAAGGATEAPASGGSSEADAWR